MAEQKFSTVFESVFIQQGAEATKKAVVDLNLEYRQLSRALLEAAAASKTISAEEAKLQKGAHLSAEAYSALEKATLASAAGRKAYAKAVGEAAQLMKTGLETSKKEAETTISRMKSSKALILTEKMSKMSLEDMTKAQGRAERAVKSLERAQKDYQEAIKSKNAANIIAAQDKLTAAFSRAERAQVKAISTTQIISQTYQKVTSGSAAWRNNLEKLYMTTVDYDKALAMNSKEYNSLEKQLGKLELTSEEYLATSQRMTQLEIENNTLSKSRARALKEQAGAMDQLTSASKRQAAANFTPRSIASYNTASITPKGQNQLPVGQRTRAASSLSVPSREDTHLLANLRRASVISPQISQLSYVMGAVTSASMLMTVGVVAAVAATVKLGTAAFKTAAEMQKYEVTMRALAQHGWEKNATSAEAVASMAKAVNREMLEGAAESIYSIDKLAAGTEKLIGYGIDMRVVNREMKMLGDLALGDSNRLDHLAIAYGQVFGQGKARAQEMYQFVNAGIPIFELLAQKMNKSTAEIMDMTRNGEITFEVIHGLLKDITSEGGRYQDLAKTLSELSFNNQLTVTMNNLRLVMNDIGKVVLPGFTDALARANRSFIDWRKNKNTEDIIFGATSTERKQKGMSYYDQYTPEEKKRALEDIDSRERLYNAIKELDKKNRIPTPYEKNRGVAFLDPAEAGPNTQRYADSLKALLVAGAQINSWKNQRGGDKALDYIDPRVEERAKLYNMDPAKRSQEQNNRITQLTRELGNEPEQRARLLGDFKTQVEGFFEILRDVFRVPGETIVALRQALPKAYIDAATGQNALGRNTAGEEFYGDPSKDFWYKLDNAIRVAWETAKPLSVSDLAYREDYKGFKFEKVDLVSGGRADDLGEAGGKDRTYLLQQYVDSLKEENEQMRELVPFYREYIKIKQMKDKDTTGEMPMAKTQAETLEAEARALYAQKGALDVVNKAYATIYDRVSNISGIPEAPILEQLQKQLDTMEKGEGYDDERALIELILELAKSGSDIGTAASALERINNALAKSPPTKSTGVKAAIANASTLEDLGASDAYKGTAESLMMLQDYAATHSEEEIESLLEMTAGLGNYKSELDKTIASTLLLYQARKLAAAEGKDLTGEPSVHAGVIARGNIDNAPTLGGALGSAVSGGVESLFSGALDDKLSELSKAEEALAKLEASGTASESALAEQRSEVERLANAYAKLGAVAGITASVLGKVTDVLATATFNALSDAMYDIGRSLADSDEEMESMTERMKDWGREIVNQLPAILLQGAMAAFSTGAWPVGIALLAAALGSSFLNGVMGSKEDAKEEDDNQLRILENLQQQFELMIEQFRNNLLYLDVARQRYISDSQLAHVSAYADGESFGGTSLQPGVYRRPTFFNAYASGDTFNSVMAEAGAEAVLPLKRNAAGQLGVIAGGSSGATVNVIIEDHAGVKVASSSAENTSEGINLKLVLEQAVLGTLSSGKADGVMRSRYRVSAVGRN